MENNELKAKIVKRVMRPLRWAWYSLFFLLFLIVFTYFITKLPVVQNYIADKALNLVSGILYSKTTIKEVNLNIFSGFHFEEIYVEDLNKDTLLYVEDVQMDLLNTLKSIYNKEFHVGDIKFTNGVFNLTRGPNDPRNNLDELLFFDDSIVRDTSNSKKSRGFDFDVFVNNIHCENFTVTNVDSFYAIKYTTHFDDLKIKMDSMDVPNNKFIINELIVNKPSFVMTGWELPERDSILNNNTTEASDSPKSAVNEVKKKLDLRANNIIIQDGLFSLDDNRYEPYEYPYSSFDPSHILFENIDFKVSNVVYDTPYYAKGILDELTLKSDEFVIKNATANEIFVGKNKAGLRNLDLRSNNSILRDEIIFKYRKLQHWIYFVDKVIMDANVKNSRIAVKDLMYWAPELQNNTFFKENYDKNLLVNADVTGRVNSLNVRGIKINIGNDFELKGNFIGRNLTTPDDAIVNARIDLLKTRMNTLNKLIPGFNPPDNFYKLNNIEFKGRYDGFFQDFVAYGELTSDVGRADMDMRLNLKEGASKASYSGLMNLYDFDLKKWSGNNEFGSMSVTAAIENGRGLDAKSAYADLKGELIALDFRGYRYNGIVNGKFEQNLFDGKFQINEPNIKLDFLGNLNFQNDIPSYDFEADVDHINLKSVNLHKDITHLEGKYHVQLKGKSVDDIVGTAKGNNIVITSKTDSLVIASIDISSSLKNDLRTLDFDSDVAKGNIKGRFILTELPDVAINIFKKHYPVLLRNVKNINSGVQSVANVDFKAELKYATPVFDFFLEDTLRLDYSKISGLINSEQSQVNTDIYIPAFRYNDLLLDTIKGNLRRVDDRDELQLELLRGKVNGVLIDKVDMIALSNKDTIDFKIKTPVLFDSIQQVLLDGEMVLAEDQTSLSFDKFTFDLINERWNISKNNNIVLREEYIELENFALKGGDKKVEFNDINNNKGIEAQINKLDLFLFNQWIDEEMVNIDGKLSSDFSIKNVFTLEGVDMIGDIESFTFNDNLLGNADMNIETNFAKSKSIFNLDLDNEGKVSKINGYVNTNTRVTNTKIHLEGLPLKILESILDENISRTTGEVYGDIEVKGRLDDLNTVGTGEIINGATQVDYLGLYLEMMDAKFEVGKNYIDFTDSKLIDVNGNVANVIGGITHENFSNLGAACRIESDKFILINTNEEINPYYYGFGQGKATVDINGLFTDIKIDITATTAEDTNLTLPINSTKKARDESFITITTREDFIKEIELEGNEDASSEYVGLTLKLFLTVTPEADMTILFDRSSGHLLKGNGAGSINLFLDPDGDISMTGDFNVESGIYDFGLSGGNVISRFFKKRFYIKENGTVQWNGDPINATLDITAQYKPIRTSLELLLSEYLSTSELEELAKEEQDVQLTARLTERLLNPKIEFDLAFPNLTGELKTFTQSKMVALESDPVSLNNQVFSLLILNNFFNPNGGAAAQNVLGAGYVALSDFLSSQVSDLASTMLESVLDENGFIYDLDIDFKMNSTFGTEQGGSTTSFNSSDEYGLKLTPKFNVENLDISFSGDLYDPTADNSFINESYFGYDFLVDYYLNKDKSLKLRGYYRLDKDDFDGNRRHRTGAGLYFKKQFRSLWGIERKLRSLIKDVSEKEDIESQN